MKTTEELRKELEQLKREEFDTCLDFSHKIKPLEKQLKAAEKGDLLFEDFQVRSKLVYVNDLLTNSGIPLLVARKSDILDYTHSSEVEDCYKKLALLYCRKGNKGFQLLDVFEVVESVGDLLDQLALAEQHIDLLAFLCSLTKSKDRPPYYRGQLGKGELNFHYFGEESSLVDGSTLFITYNSETDRYTIGFEKTVKSRCDIGAKLPTLSGIATKTEVHLPDLDRLTVIVSMDNVRSTDLQSALDELKTRLLRFLNQKEHEVTVAVRVVID